MLAVVLASFLAGRPVSAKQPGSVYCFKGVCHRVKTIEQTENLVGKTLTLRASHYSHCRHDRFNPCGLTSSGEAFRANSPDNAASPDLPDGTIVLLYYPATGKAAVVRVNNAGPYWGNRRLDVSRATARSLGFARRGVAELEARILRAPREFETRYRRHRRYRAVPGFIGQHASIEAAYASLVLMASAAKTPTSGKKVRRAQASARALEAIPIRQATLKPEIAAADEIAGSRQIKAARLTERPLVAMPLAAAPYADQRWSRDASGKLGRWKTAFCSALVCPKERPRKKIFELKIADKISPSGINGDVVGPAESGEGLHSLPSQVKVADRQVLASADISFAGYASDFTLKPQMNEAQKVIAWNDEAGVLDGFTSLVASASDKARHELEFSQEEKLTAHQKSQSQQVAKALSGTFSNFARAVGGIMRYAVVSARESIDHAAREKRETFGGEFLTSRLEQKRIARR